MMDGLLADLTIHILKFLDVAVDIANSSLVCRGWRQSVMEGRLWRDLCLKEYPELQNLEKFIEDRSVKISIFAEIVSACVDELQNPHEKEHRVFSRLYSELRRPPLTQENWICTGIAASSTDKWPWEGIDQTLNPQPRLPPLRDYATYWSYWSSAGQDSDDVPETLTYKLRTPLCAVHEIKVRPFKAEFEHRSPVYSSKSIRFRLGYLRQIRPDHTPEDHPVQAVWTYESPEYPVKQVDELQSFKLPRPVLCIGQIVQVEFLGRMQKQLMDSRYYIRICHVSVAGRPISLNRLKIRGPRGKQYVDMGELLLETTNGDFCNSLGWI